MTQDRVGSNSLPLTQEFMAQMLGTRRNSVTVAAGTLQAAGLIAYTRGSVTMSTQFGRGRLRLLWTAHPADQGMAEAKRLILLAIAHLREGM